MCGASWSATLQGVLQATAGSPGDERQPPRLDVGVRRRVLGEGEGFVDNLPGHRQGQELPGRMTLSDRSIEVRHRHSHPWLVHVLPFIGTTGHPARRAMDSVIACFPHSLQHSKVSANPKWLVPLRAGLEVANFLRRIAKSDETRG